MSILHNPLYNVILFGMSGLIGAFIAVSPLGHHNPMIRVCGWILVALTLFVEPYLFIAHRAFFASVTAHISSGLNSDTGVALLGSVTEGVVIGLVISAFMMSTRRS